jgi:hypothetical protein
MGQIQIVSLVLFHFYVKLLEVLLFINFWIAKVTSLDPGGGEAGAELPFARPPFAGISSVMAVGSATSGIPSLTHIGPYQGF